MIDTLESQPARIGRKTKTRTAKLEGASGGSLVDLRRFHVAFETVCQR